MTSPYVLYMIPPELRMTWAFKDWIIPKNPRYHLTWASKAGSRPCLLNVINSSNDCAEGGQVIIGYSFHYVTKITVKNNPQSSPIHLSKILSFFFLFFFWKFYVRSSAVISRSRILCFTRRSSVVFQSSCIIFQASCNISTHHIRLLGSCSLMLRVDLH